MASEEEFSKRAVEVFRECCRVPIATDARITASIPGNDGGKDKLEVAITWTQKDIERGKKIASSKSYFLERDSQGEIQSICASTFQSDASNVVKVSYGPEASGRGRKAVLLNDKASNAELAAEPKQYIEVWNEEGLEKTINVADIKDHGKIHEDIHFGSFQLSPDGQQLLYIAERKKPKATSFFTTTPPPKDDPPPLKGAEFDYESNWGEQLESVVHPVPVVMEIASEKVTVIDLSECGEISAGQSVWVPGEEGGVVFIGWEELPRKLGFVYCLCRRSAVYYADTKSGKCTKLTGSEYDVWCPRFSPDGKRLIYFQSMAGGPHHSCAALIMMDWSTKAVRTVVDVVPKPASVGGFPGLYTVFLPERCWDSTGTRLLFHNNWGSLVKVTEVNVETGDVADVSGEDRKGAWLVLDVSHDIIVAQFASLNTTPQLYVGAIPEKGSKVIKWVALSHTSSHVTDGLTWEQLPFEVPNMEEGASGPASYEGLLLQPATPPATPLHPLVVLPHGGPHVVSPADFLPWPVCLAALGYAVLLVNYRGSMGFGQDGIMSLPGHVGTQDVQDVQNAVREVVSRGGVAKDRVYVVGGSHGGFLTGHLIGQFPDFYHAAAMRNPVIDMATMWGASDIPDWTCVEGGFPYDAATPPSGKDLGVLQSKSPISHISKVRVPVLIHIGGRDLRCPPSQGLLYYHTLRAQGTKTRLLYYPKDSHPISSIQSDADAFVNTANWFYGNSH